jgi:dipeptidyl aminopeptidase/acylaminoacyl peptidase
MLDALLHINPEASSQMDIRRKEINLSDKYALACLTVLLLFSSFLAWIVPKCDAQQMKRPFTVSDEIDLTLFGDLERTVAFSPDGNYFVVYSERGRSDRNRPEDSLRFYRSQDIQKSLAPANEAPAPSPMWVLSMSTNNEGPIITEWRWLSNSTGVTFLARNARGNRQLVLADLGKKRLVRLTLPTESVMNYDVHDPRHYVYTITDQVRPQTIQADHRAPAIAGAGRSIFQLLLPEDPVTDRISSASSYLWASVDDKHFQVKNHGRPIAIDRTITLSPDGKSLVTSMSVSDVPLSWETLYPPPFAADPYRIKVGSRVRQYVRIDLQTGFERSLTDAPDSDSTGSWASVLATPSWSRDGRAVLLPGTFVSSKGNAPSRPCVAVVNILSDTRTCVEMLRGHTETGVETNYHLIQDVHFADAHANRVVLVFRKSLDSPPATLEYRHTDEDTWEVTGQSDSAPERGRDGLEVRIEQAFDKPPQLVAKNRHTSRVIWDPNPQLKDIDLGLASIYTWNDKEGRKWRGGLYKPSNFDSAERYPLVIQTHGFPELGFRPSGVFPTAFAARALAAAGILVLQVGFSCPVGTPDEAPCAVSGYEAAAKQLVSEGLVDPERIGIIGFSRTCLYVMDVLTTGSIHLRAASITDGWMLDYCQYMLMPERLAAESNSMIGVPPFGEGLRQWVKLSPGFNLDKISSPLLVVAEGRVSLLFMWQPYTALHYLQKPVELIMLNTDEHVLTNPSVRLASQGGSVDWFRFWLQGYEDPDPAKSGQYVRWRELRKLEDANKSKWTTLTPQVVIK